MPMNFPKGTYFDDSIYVSIFDIILITFVYRMHMWVVQVRVDVAPGYNNSWFTEQELGAMTADAGVPEHIVNNVNKLVSQ